MSLTQLLQNYQNAVNDSENVEKPDIGGSHKILQNATSSLFEALLEASKTHPLLFIENCGSFMSVGTIFSLSNNQMLHYSAEQNSKHCDRALNLTLIKRIAIAKSNKAGSFN